jgi:hypothetical protein
MKGRESKTEEGEEKRKNNALIDFRETYSYSKIFQVHNVLYYSF